MARGDSGNERVDLDLPKSTLTPAHEIALEKARLAALHEILTAETVTTRDENGLKMKSIDLAKAPARGYDSDGEDYAAGVRDGISWAKSIILLKLGMAAHDSDPSRQA